MKRENSHQLRAGVWLSYINLAIGSLIPFFYTPVMLRLLGQEEYGLYSLANSVISYLSLLSFGLGSTIVRYIAKYRAEKNEKAIKETFGLFLLIYCAVAFLVCTIGLIISQNVQVIFNKGLTESEVQKMRILVVLMSFNTGISFPISVFSSVALAYEKFIFRRCVDICFTIAAPVANLVALMFGFGSVGMVVSATALQLIVLPINAIYCKNVLGISPKVGRIQRSLLREMIGFSLFVFVGTLTDMLFWSTDKVILGMLSGSVAVAVYNIGGTFNTIVMSLSTSISGVLGPKVTGMVVKNASPEDFTEIFIRVGRIQFIIIALIISGFSVFGQTFITLWAGPEYEMSFWVAALTLFPLCVPLIQNTGVSIVVAQNKHQFRSIVYLIIAVINVISTYLVIPQYGVVGAAMCSCVSYLVGQGVIMNIYYYKVTHLDIPLFWKNIIVMAVVPLTMMGGSRIILKLGVISNWGTFFIGVACFTIIYFAAMYLCIMTDYEKDIIRKPIAKILSVMKGKV